MAKPPWENGYADLSIKTFGGPSAEIIEVADDLQPSARVLDLGCGEGRNAVFLAERGFNVTAVDFSESGIAKLRSLAEKKGIHIRTGLADMREYIFGEMFDLIVSHGCLHLIERDQWQQMINKFKDYTHPGGTNVVAVFTDTLPPPSDLAEHCLGLFKEGELFSQYIGWDIILQKSYTFEDEHPGSPRHVHPVNKIVARRPSIQRMNAGQ